MSTLHQDSQFIDRLCAMLHYGQAATKFTDAELIEQVDLRVDDKLEAFSIESSLLSELISRFRAAKGLPVPAESEPTDEELKQIEAEETAAQIGRTGGDQLIS